MTVDVRELERLIRAFLATETDAHERENVAKLG